MISFIIFKIAVMLFSSLGGSALVVTGVLALLYLYPQTSEKVEELVFAHRWFLPVLLIVPTGIGLILQLMAETGETVSQLVSEVGSYYMSKDKFAADKSQANRILESAKKHFADAELNTTDGCRFDFSDGWLHLRTSNTEPVMRLIVEAKDESAAEKYIDAVMNIRKEMLG